MLIRLEEIEEAGSGDIVALFGVDCASGDTFCDDTINVFDEFHACSGSCYLSGHQTGG